MVMFLRKKRLGNLIVCIMLTIFLGLGSFILPVTAAAADGTSTMELVPEDEGDNQILADPADSSDNNAGDAAPLSEAPDLNDDSENNGLEEEVLTAPALRADTAENIIGQPAEIAFTDEGSWSTSISRITVDGTELSSEQYTIYSEKIAIAAGVFTVAGDYQISVQADGYADAGVTQTMTAIDPVDSNARMVLMGIMTEGSPPPVLTADAADNRVGNAIDITFAEDEAWRNAIAEVTVDGAAIASEKYSAATGKLTFDASLFATAKDYAIVVKASGYSDATVTQTVLAVLLPLPAGDFTWTSNKEIPDKTRIWVTVTVPDTTECRTWVAAVNQVVVQKDSDPPVEFPKSESNQTVTDSNEYLTASYSPRSVILGARDYFEDPGTYTITISAGGYMDYVYSYTITPVANRAPEKNTYLQNLRFDYNNPVAEIVLPIDKIAMDRDGDELDFVSYTPDYTASFYSLRYNAATKSVIVTAAWDEATAETTTLNSTVPVTIKEVTDDAFSVTVNLSITMELQNGPTSWTADTSANSGFDSAAGGTIGNVTVTGAISSSYGTKYLENFYRLTVNGTTLEPGQYTVSGTYNKPLVTINKSVFTQVGNYTIGFWSKGFKPTTVTQPIVAPFTTASVTADSPTLIYSDFSVTPLKIDFAASITKDQITAVKFYLEGATSSKNIATQYYSVVDHQLIINMASNNNAYFATAPGNHRFAISVTGYPDIEVPYSLTAVTDTKPAIMPAPDPVYMGEDIVLTFDKDDPGAVAYADSIAYIKYSSTLLEYDVDVAAGTVTIKGKKADDSSYFSSGSCILGIIVEGYTLNNVTQTISKRLSPKATAAAETIFVYPQNAVVFNYDKNHTGADAWADNITKITLTTPVRSVTLTVNSSALTIDKNAGTIAINADVLKNYFISVGTYTVTIIATGYQDEKFYQKVVAPVVAADSTVAYKGHSTYDAGDPAAILPTWSIDFGSSGYKRVKTENQQVYPVDLTTATEGTVTTITPKAAYLGGLAMNRVHTFSFEDNSGAIIACATVYVCRDSAEVLQILEGGNTVKTFTMGQFKAIAAQEGDKTYDVSMINSFGTKKNETGFMGPTVRGIIEAAYGKTLEEEFGADNFGTTTMKVAAPDGYWQTPTFTDVFGTRYYFPNILAADAAETWEGQEVLPAFIAYNIDDGKFIIGQCNPLDMNNPTMVKNMFTNGKGIITITRDAALSSFASNYVKEAVVGDVTVAAGGTAAAPVRAGADTKVEFIMPNMDQYAILYYTINKDGSTPQDPDPSMQEGVFKYNIKTYDTPYIFDHPILDTPGTTVIKAQAYKIGMLPSQVFSFTFNVEANITPALTAASGVKVGEDVVITFSEDAAWRAAITEVDVDGAAIAYGKYDKTAAGRITLDASLFTAAKDYTIVFKAAGYPDATLIQTVMAEPDPVYTLSPQTDAVYTTGTTGDGIDTMTVNSGHTGLKYFAVDITPVVSHEGNETVVFSHLRNGVQLELNASVADFDVSSTAKAGFNVNPGDVIKVYIVDQLTNDANHNPIVFQ